MNANSATALALLPSALPLPVQASDELAPAARRVAVLGVIAAHLAAGWGLMQVAEVRQAVGEVAPLMVELISAPTSPAVLPPAPPTPPIPTPPIQPSPPAPPRARVPAPAPVTSVAPTPAPASFETPTLPPASPEPTAPAPVAAIEAPPAPPAAAAQPKTIAITAVEYLTPPVLVYPAASKRFGESGRVLVRVLVDAEGRPRQMAISQSSGHPRLDEAALATVRATRFKPYTEDGRPQPFAAVMPLDFILENRP